jgi:beta-lactamase class D
MSSLSPIVRGIAFAIAGAATAALAGHAAAGTRVIDGATYAAELQGVTIAFLARDLETGTDYVLEGSDLDSRHPPWSTFKIPNLLIALETGVAPSLEAWRDWDPERRPATDFWPDSWKQGHTLGSAFARSAIWYFQDLALEIGADNYRKWLSDWDYGNASVTDGSDDFWLGGSLRISVREQVDFLEALVERELNLSGPTYDALDIASLQGEAPGVSLHGKTGTGPDDPDDLAGSFTGWYAGYLQRDGRAPVVFALYMAAPSFARLRDFRKAFSLTLLEATGLAPAGAFSTPPGKAGGG